MHRAGGGVEEGREGAGRGDPMHRADPILTELLAPDASSDIHTADEQCQWEASAGLQHAVLAPSESEAETTKQLWH